MWKEYIRPIGIMLLLLCSFRSAIADYNVVPSGSMKPTIIEGDRIFVNKLAYDLKIPFTNVHVVKWGDPQRGDVIVFDSPKDGIRLVKRVVGIPGDTILVRDNRVFINGQPATYSPLSTDTINQVQPSERAAHGYAVENINGQSHPVMSTGSIHDAMRNFGPIVVPPGKYFVMGDNRDNSADSRYIGLIPRDAIAGRSSRVLMSLNYDNYYLPRLHRWFRALP
jgi:signal peptidase I